MYPHENNFNTKITSNYRNCGNEIAQFKKEYYLPMRQQIEQLDFDQDSIDIFKKATVILNTYRTHLHKFADRTNIASQSKFESSFLEEISCYLFKNYYLIKDGELSIYNKGIYAGLKISEKFAIETIKKDVDFCIGKKVLVTIDNQDPIELIIPAICVEVKTYLDATMFGEIKSSSKTLKSATPNSKAYVLMGYKNIADEHIMAARQDSTLDEMFVLQENEFSDIDYSVLQQYYTELSLSLQNITKIDKIVVPGRLLKIKD